MLSDKMEQCTVFMNSCALWDVSGAFWSFSKCNITIPHLHPLCRCETPLYVVNFEVFDFRLSKLTGRMAMENDHTHRSEISAADRRHGQSNMCRCRHFTVHRHSPVKSDTVVLSLR